MSSGKITTEIIILSWEKFIIIKKKKQASKNEEEAQNPKNGFQLEMSKTEED